jgi:hypothetical protein
VPKGGGAGSFTQGNVAALERRENTMPQQRMLAEIVLLRPRELERVMANLIELDFEVHFLGDWLVGSGPHVWILATALSELDPEAFFTYAQGIVEKAVAYPLDSFVVEAGPAPADIEAWIAGWS